MAVQSQSVRKEEERRKVMSKNCAGVVNAPEAARTVACQKVSARTWCLHREKSRQVAVRCYVLRYVVTARGLVLASRREESTSSTC